jgi:hypothetical protein
VSAAFYDRGRSAIGTMISLVKCSRLSDFAPFERFALVAAGRRASS